VRKEQKQKDHTSGTRKGVIWICKGTHTGITEGNPDLHELTPGPSLLCKRGVYISDILTIKETEES
jgi:hypothetical protein